MRRHNKWFLLSGFILMLSPTWLTVKGSWFEGISKWYPELKQAIYPGTKWCGPGDIAANYSDLGTGMYTKADACCRNHDHCPDFMRSGDIKYNLTNRSSYTKLSCKCDQEFYDCLKNNDDQISLNIGFLYFDFLRTECYKQEHPIISCKQQKTFFKLVCTAYLVDKKKRKKWQWFDVPLFSMDNN